VPQPKSILKKVSKKTGKVASKMSPKWLVAMLVSPKKGNTNPPAPTQEKGVEHAPRASGKKRVVLTAPPEVEATTAGKDCVTPLRNERTAETPAPTRRSSRIRTSARKQSQFDLTRSLKATVACFQSSQSTATCVGATRCPHCAEAERLVCGLLSLTLEATNVSPPSRENVW